MQGLFSWAGNLLNGTLPDGQAPAGLDGLDLGLLAAASSAQASLLPGVIDAHSAAATVVGRLNVPMATAQQSAIRLPGRMREWGGGKDKPSPAKAAQRPKE
jgi:hypothetical protein